MLGVVIGIVVVLAAGVMVVFLTPLAISFALVLKLRSITPHSPGARSEAERIRAHTIEMVSDKPR